MSEFQQHPDNSYDEPQHPFRWPDRLIGRAQEVQRIEDALHAWPFNKRLLYLKGEGGVGKTRLLKETAQRAKQMPNILSTELIDLYHFRYHQPMMMMLTIAKQLRESLESKGDSRPAFKDFYDAIDRYFAESGGKAIGKFAGNGGSVAIEVGVRKQLTSTFVQEYRKLAADYGIVLLIDTFEKLHPVIEEANAFNFRKASRFEDWIVTELIPQLDATLTLVAGRGNSRQNEFPLLTDVQVETLPVRPLSKDETIEFIKESLKRSGVTITANLIEQLYSYSHGKPVVLSLALAYIQLEDGEGGLPMRAGSEEVSEAELIDAIIRSLQERHQQLANSLQRAFLLRKGLNIDLLMQLDHEDDPEEVRDRIDYHARFPFFKRTGQRRDEDIVVVLHDELYDRFYGRLPEGDKRHDYTLAITYIQGLIDDLLKRIDQGEGSKQSWLKAEASGEIGEKAFGESMRMQAAQEIHLMRVEQLFYELARNPKRGYQEYRRLSNAAIQAHDEDFDTLLQDELARFFELTPGITQGWGQNHREELARQGVSWDQVVFEEGVRWVERRLNAYKPGEDRYAEALWIADQVQNRYPHMYEQNELARYALDAARLRARMYQSHEALNGQAIPKAFTNVAQSLEQLIDQLECDSAHLEQADRPLHDDDLAIQASEVRYAKLVLAALYNDFGYYERMQERYKSAAEKYTRAIRFYNELGPEANGLRAVVLTNLAFARHQQGLSKRGLGLVNAALELATKYGSPHQIATTLNMLARIQLRRNVFGDDGAEGAVSKARAIFNTLNSGRGSALCALTEGNVFSALAARHVETDHSAANREKAKQDYNQAIERYAFAIKKFDEQPHSSSPQPQSELLRRIEARVGLGAVYRERGLLQRQQHVVLDGIDPNADLQRALDLFDEAWRLCQHNGEVPALTQIAILEDMVFVYVEQGAFGKAREKLKLARELIPAGYQIREGQGIVYSPNLEEHWSYWLRLSQLELQDALIGFRLDHVEIGCRHLLRSFACLHTFSPFAPVRRTIRELGKRELQRAVERLGRARAQDFYEQIGELRRSTSSSAQALYIPQPIVVELDELFDELEGLINDDDQTA